MGYPASQVPAPSVSFSNVALALAAGNDNIAISGNFAASKYTQYQFCMYDGSGTAYTAFTSYPTGFPFTTNFFAGNDLIIIGWNFYAGTGVAPNSTSAGERYPVMPVY